MSSNEVFMICVTPVNDLLHEKSIFDSLTMKKMAYLKQNRS